MTQFIACAFRKGGRRYSYRNEGEPVAVGDIVKVPARDFDANGSWSRVHVEAVLDGPPGFETRAILGRVEPEAPAEDTS